MIRCIAIDDEPLALRKIEAYASKVQSLELIKCFNSALDAIEFLKETDIDLIFLDIQMNDLTGIQMLEALNVRPKVIITTAYDEYALKGYELDITDYLLKPFSFHRFIKSVNKLADNACNSLQVNMDKDATNSDISRNCIFVKSGNKIERVNVDDIIYIEGMKDYLKIHLPHKRIITLQTFKKITSQLDHDIFQRIHKSYIVAITKVDSIEPKRVFIGGHCLPIGESYKKPFFDFLKKRQFI